MENPTDQLVVVAAKVGEVKAAAAVEHQIVGNIAPVGSDDGFHCLSVRPHREDATATLQVADPATNRRRSLWMAITAGPRTFFGTMTRTLRSGEIRIIRPTTVNRRAKAPPIGVEEGPPFHFSLFSFACSAVAFIHAEKKRFSVDEGPLVNLDGPMNSDTLIAIASRTLPGSARYPALG